MTDAGTETIEIKLQRWFDNLRQHQRTSSSGGPRRAPHKPLLLLRALAAVQRGADRLEAYESAVGPMTTLLTTYGRPVVRQTVHDPFWRLFNDGDFWDLPERDMILHCRDDGRSDSDINKRELRLAHAGFTAPIHNFLRDNPTVVNRLAARLLDQHFATSLHEDILGAVKMPWTPTQTVSNRTRDPRFRREILRIYDGRCAICGYDGRISGRSIGVEAAHVQWHSAAGPDTPENGLALCALHHKALDHGAVGIDESRRVLVSQRYRESNALGSVGVLAFQGNELAQPISGPSYAVAKRFAAWHLSEVFRGPARYI